MSDPMKQAWNDVAEGFSALGRMMKDRYQEAADDETTPSATPDDGGAGAALRDAFDRLVAAGRELGDRAADVIRDDDVKAQARQAGATLNDALAATVDLIGGQVGGLFNRAKDTDSSADTDSSPEIVTSEPTADDARQ